MRVLWTHNFNPSLLNSGCFMHTTAKGLKEIGVDLHLEYLGDLRSPLRIAHKRKYIRLLAEKFDIVHAQYGSACALVTSAVKDQPTILTIRGSDWKRYGSPISFSYYHSWMAFLMTRFSLPGYSAIITVSNRFRKSIEPYAPKAKYLVLPAAIDLDKWPVYESKNQGMYKRVLYTSQRLYDPVKNYELCKKVMNVTNKHIKDVVLVVATDIPYEEMPAFVASSDVILCTSESEGWPNSIKEALACNVPFVATDVSDLADIAAQEPSCRVCLSDVNILAKNLCEVLQMPRPRNLRKFVEPMDIKASSIKLCSFYESLLKN